MTAIPITRPAFADRLPAREPTLNEAMKALAYADDTLLAYCALPMPEANECWRLQCQLMDAQEVLLAAFAKHGIDKELVRRIGGVL